VPRRSRPNSSRRSRPRGAARPEGLPPEPNPGRRGAARVLDTYADLGQKHIGEHLPAYAEAAELIARADLAAVAHHADVADMAETVVVGTVLGDALNASLRRMAQEHVSYQVFPAPRGAEPSGSER